VDAVGLYRVVGNKKDGAGKVLLNDVSLTLLPEELVAIVGGSGTGKTTLLNVLAGVQPPSAGQVYYNGEDLYQNLGYFRTVLGYVPQDDIVHKELSVERTLHYAARLRLSHETSSEDRSASIRDALQVLGLTAQAKQKVASLSGGQRKRASIAVELLTKPRIFFLDEPTSGLDPATGRGMMKSLHQLAEAGNTVVLTTHNPQDIAVCDKVVFLAGGGHVAFIGSPRQALGYFQVQAFEEVYERLASEKTPERWAEEFRSIQSSGGPSSSPSSKTQVEAADPPPVERQRNGVGFLRQWLVLTQRNFETLTRNWLTLGILIGSPIAVVLMFVILFRRGSFDFDSPSPSAALMILFWMAFNSFFFGLTYGLLQICTEIPIFSRERLVFLKVASYVLSKLTVLLPVLVFSVVLMVAALAAFLRLPPGGVEMYAQLVLTLVLNGLAALALGLLLSALMSRPEQATLALPMLCFPAVLFSGGVLPIPVTAIVGKFIGLFLSSRWTFEGLGQVVDINNLLSNGNSPLGPPLLLQYEDSFSRPIAESWAILVAFIPVFLGLTWWVLLRKRVALT
jgi:ABC-type multidrug transport system ATPase subunit/ABC-type transport system involved in multi-copper enzyme maturation permease subunit